MKISKSSVAAKIKKVAGKMADISCGATSVWGMYQPKAPANIRNIKK